MSMEGARWTEEQLIDFVKSNGYPAFNARTLKRYRAEKVVEGQVEHPSFGGTSTWYAPEAGLRAVAICQLLRRRRSYDFVRISLWLDGHPVELSLLKESLWRLTPFSSWVIPTAERERILSARKLARTIVKVAWQSVRSNLIRRILQQFHTVDDQFWFVHLHTQLLYGVPVDFRRDFLNEGDTQAELEENADVFAYGLQTQRVSTLPQDLARDLQRLADEQLLSLTKLHAGLFAATAEDLVLARTRLDILQNLFELLDLMGQLSKPFRLFLRFFASSAMKAWFLIFLLVLEQYGYGSTIEMVGEAIRINAPIIKRGLAVRKTLQNELPSIAHEIVDLSTIERLASRGSQREHDAYTEHLREVYRENNEALDAFWERHPELKGDDA